MRCSSLALLLSAVVAFPVAAQTPAPYSYAKIIDTMVPMRDGIRMHTSVYMPIGLARPVAIILLRTPYGIANSASRMSSGSFRELAADGYAFAFQDIRGHYGSEGTFVMQRAPRDRKDPKAIDEGSDAWDTMDWLVKQVPNNNGRIGMLGVSYDGWLVVQALMDPHPAFKAASPQASPADMWMGDDFHHQGAFRLSYGFEYAFEMEQGKETKNFPFDRADTYTWYLNLGGLSRVNKEIFKELIPTWNDYVNHPDYDGFWQKQAAAPYFTRPVSVPTLNVAGWWDQEDFYGPVTIYRAMEKHDTGNMNFLVVGPWNHGGWGGVGKTLGLIDFGSNTGDYYRNEIQRAFFACHLQRAMTGCHPEEATLFRGGENKWVTSKSFPRTTGVTPTPIYTAANGALSFSKPTAADASDPFISDPANPVPYRRRPIQPTYGAGSTWRVWLTEDQRFVENRPDVLSWQTEPLTKAVTLSGEIGATLYASTSGSDADWIVKLIDVYPDSLGPVMGGYEFMIANDVFRGRYLDSFTKPRALVPGKVEKFTIDLHTQEYTFLPGHRIMVQVQSSWFPLIDRNPQRYLPNIFNATSADFRTAVHRVQRSALYPTHLTLPIVDGQ